MYFRGRKIKFKYLIILLIVSTLLIILYLNRPLKINNSPPEVNQSIELGNDIETNTPTLTELIDTPIITKPTTPIVSPSTISPSTNSASSSSNSNSDEKIESFGVLGPNEMIYNHIPDLDAPNEEKKDQLKEWYSFAQKTQEIFTSKKAIERPNVVRKDVLLDLYGNPVDFVIAIKFVHCSIKLSVRNINLYLKPRYIWFISANKDHCNTLITLADNVKCIWEDEIYPNLNSQKLKSIITHPKTSKRRGWYYLQLLNFGVARHLPDLAKTYVVWDSDNVPMSSDLTFFNYEKHQYKFYTQRDHYHEGLAKGYHASYKTLTGHDMLHPDPKFTVKKPTPVGDWKSETWVAHFMVWYKPYVREIMDHIESYRKLKPGDWNIEVCNVIQHPNHANYFDGFGDYDIYGSWMKQYHLNEVHALMGSHKRAIRPHKTDYYKKGTCCVPQKDYDSWVKNKYLNVVIEIHKGDSASCQTDEINMIGLKDGDKLLN